MMVNKAVNLELNRKAWDGVLRISADSYYVGDEPHITVSLTIFPEDDIPFGISKVFNLYTAFHTSDFPDVGLLAKLNGAYGESLSRIVEDALIHINDEIKMFFLFRVLDKGFSLPHV